MSSKQDGHLFFKFVRFVSEVSERKEMDDGIVIFLTIHKTTYFVYLFVYYWNYKPEIVVVHATSVRRIAIASNVLDNCNTILVCIILLYHL